MIVTANENYINVIMNLSAEDPFACRIISQYNSYDSSLAFVDYWTIIDDKTDECTGAISRCGTNFILFLTDKTNLEEVSSFMRVAGASSAICSGDFNLNLYGSKSVSGLILKKSEPFENVDESINFDVPDIKEVYNLIVSCADENFVPPPFDKLVAMAMTVAESSNGAVLGAVSCHPDYRKHGYGSTVVKYISNRLIAENKTVYLHRAKNANQSFYNNLGFEQCGSWQEYYFER
jgi:Predicted acetyltransferase